MRGSDCNIPKGMIWVPEMNLDSRSGSMLLLLHVF